jgi:hypothetical protein
MVHSESRSVWCTYIVSQDEFKQDLIFQQDDRSVSNREVALEGGIVLQIAMAIPAFIIMRSARKHDA